MNVFEKEARMFPILDWNSTILSRSQLGINYNFDAQVNLLAKQLKKENIISHFSSSSFDYNTISRNKFFKLDAAFNKLILSINDNKTKISNDYKIENENSLSALKFIQLISSKYQHAKKIRDQPHQIEIIDTQEKNNSFIGVKSKRSLKEKENVIMITEDENVKQSSNNKCVKLEINEDLLNIEVNIL